MKTIFRLVWLVVLISGWGLAAMALHVVRTPDPLDATKSRLVVIPKDRLNVTDTWVDARTWTMADVPKHPAVVQRLIATGKADELKFLGDPKNNADMQTQLTQALGGAGNPASQQSSPMQLRPRAASRPGNSQRSDASILPVEIPVSF